MMAGIFSLASLPLRSLVQGWRRPVPDWPPIARHRPRRRNCGSVLPRFQLVQFPHYATNKSFRALKKARKDLFVEMAGIEPASGKLLLTLLQV